MIPAAFTSALQDKMGDGYTVAIHPKTRAEPQFDVFPEPRESDSEGNPYRVTFSIRHTMLAAIEAGHAIITEYAEAAAQNIAVQKLRGNAAPEWRQ